MVDFARFVEEVEPVLARHGCNAAGDCHGGGIRGTFELSPPEHPDSLFDFEQASLQILPYQLDESPILRKPLAEHAGGEPHSVEPFASTDDPDFQLIRSWVHAGRFE